MAARYGWVCALLLAMLSACAPVDPPVRLALLAPFEGRYREVGYDALYAARMALTDSATDVELLALDDGGIPATARARLEAIQQDETIHALMVIGPTATQPDVLAHITTLPAVVIGHWNVTSPPEQVFVLASASITSNLTLSADYDITETPRATTSQGTVIGSEILALKQTPILWPNADLYIMTSAALPDADFIARYQESDMFAPEPGLLASLTYDASTLLLEAMQQHTNRATVYDTIANTTYDGINGRIQFEHGYWQDAPQHHYTFTDGRLVSVNDIMEQR